jgi:hypothetical protein
MKFRVLFIMFCYHETTGDAESSSNLRRMVQNFVSIIP